MLKFFESSKTCTILLKFPITSQDCKTISHLFSEPYDSWYVDFGFIDAIEANLIEIFYQEIIKNKKRIEIITNRYKFSRYLHRLGFHVSFKQPSHRSALDIDKVEVVLIGGSADSSTKIIEIIKNVTLYSLTLVVVQHVEEKVVGKFDKVLQKYTNHKVSYVNDGEVLLKGAVYIAPNNRHLKISNGQFKLCDGDKYNFSRPSISISYESFSSFYKDRLLIVQECGYASDGVDKLEYLKENGSKIIIQDKKECEAKSMVINAYNSGFYHYTLTLNDIVRYMKLLEKEIDDKNFIDYLLEMIFQKYGHDFRLYQRSMLKRRINIFMLKYGIENIKDTIEIILFDKKMFHEFFSEISINVTELFRNPKFFSQVEDFFKHNFKKSRSIKIWSAGCSSGEEVYSIAILLKKIDMLDKSIIYATDFNKVILQEAKNGVYSKETYDLATKNYKQVDYMDNLDNYIIKNDNYVIINKDIQDKILFFQHNLAIDSSFNEFDIIICKNVLIYFDYDLQKRVFELFYNSLRFGGFLIIGESEQIHEQFRSKFKQYSLEYKVFKKVT